MKNRGLAQLAEHPAPSARGGTRGQGPGRTRPEFSGAGCPDADIPPMPVGIVYIRIPLVRREADILLWSPKLQRPRTHKPLQAGWLFLCGEVNEILGISSVFYSLQEGLQAQVNRLRYP